MSTQPDFHLDYPWYRRHDAQLIELLAAQWGGVRVELVTREAVGPCDGGMCVPHHVVSFLTEGRRSGVINSIEGSTPRRVGHDAGWTRIVPAGCHVHTHWERGRRTYLMAFIEPQHLQTLGDTYGVTVSQDLQEQVDVRDQRLARVLGDMSQELREPGLLSEVLGLAMAEQFCVQLLRLMQQQSAKLPMARGGLATRPLALVLEMIEQGLDGRLSVDALAQAAGLSVNHFAQAFRQSTGLPPHRYILEKRLDAARRLLGDPSLTLTEIALRAGFGGSSQFATAFRRATGLSPSDWRR